MSLPAQAEEALDRAINEAHSGAARLVPPQLPPAPAHVLEVGIGSGQGRHVGRLTAVGAGRGATRRARGTGVDDPGAGGVRLIAGHRPTSWTRRRRPPPSNRCGPSFHAVSVGGVPAAVHWVPPAPVTKGWLEGSSTASASSASPDSTQSSEPSSPEAATMVWPWAAASSNSVFSAWAAALPGERLAQSPRGRDHRGLVLGHDGVVGVVAAGIGVGPLVDEDVGVGGESDDLLDVHVGLTHPGVGQRATVDVHGGDRQWTCRSTTGRRRCRRCRNPGARRGPPSGPSRGRPGRRERGSRRRCPPGRRCRSHRPRRRWRPWRTLADQPTPRRATVEEGPRRLAPWPSAGAGRARSSRPTTPWTSGATAAGDLRRGPVGEGDPTPGHPVLGETGGEGGRRVGRPWPGPGCSGGWR